MNTILKSVLILAVAYGTASFTNTMTKKIDISESNIDWTGKKVLGSHHGTIKLQSGYLEIEGDQLTGGEFVVDMTSINVVDLEGESKEKLEGHLKSEDFFGVANHPTSVLKINTATKTADGYAVKGELTIKETTQPISFDLKMDENSAATSLKVDRTKFGVRYGSGSFFDNLGDNTISDTFELNVSLKF